MKKTFVLVLFAIWNIYAMAQDKGGIDWKEFNSMDEAVSYSKKVKKPLFVYFTAAWCGPCKKAQAEYFSQRKENELNRKNLVNVKIDIDKDSLLYQQSVMLFDFDQKKKIGVPRFEILDAVMDQRYTLSGFSNVVDFKQGVQFALAAMDYKNDGNAQKLIKAAKNKAGLNGLLQALRIQDPDKDLLNFFLDRLPELGDKNSFNELKEERKFQRLLSNVAGELSRKQRENIIYLLDQHQRTPLTEGDFHLFTYADNRLSALETLAKRHLQLASVPEGDAARNALFQWLLLNGSATNLYKEVELKDKLGQILPDEEVVRLWLGFKLFKNFKDFGLESKHYMESFAKYFNTFYEEPFTANRPELSPVTLNNTAWFSFFQKDTISGDMLTTALAIAFRAVMLKARYSESITQQKDSKGRLAPLSIYIDTYLQILNRMVGEKHVTIQYAKGILEDDEAAFYQVFDDGYKETYESVKAEVLTDF